MYDFRHGAFVLTQTRQLTSIGVPFLDFGEHVVGVSLTCTGDLMRLFIALEGKGTIGVVPLGRERMICTLHHGDGFSTEKTPARSRGEVGSQCQLH
jgi:hypothetical protein